MKATIVPYINLRSLNKGKRLFNVLNYNVALIFLMCFLTIKENKIVSVSRLHQNMLSLQSSLQFSLVSCEQPVLTCDPLHPGGLIDAQIVVEDLEDVPENEAEVL